MTEHEQIHTLTWSEKQGHYALDNPETGQEVGYGPLSIEVLDGVWVDGHIAYSTNYDGPGCYQIAADAGRPDPEAGARLPRQPLTQERLQRIEAAAEKTCNSRVRFRSSWGKRLGCSGATTLSAQMATS